MTPPGEKREVIETLPTGSSRGQLGVDGTREPRGGHHSRSQREGPPWDERGEGSTRSATPDASKGHFEKKGLRFILELLLLGHKL